MVELALIFLVGLGLGALLVLGVGGYLINQRMTKTAESYQATIKKLHAESVGVRQRNAQLRHQAADLPGVQAELEQTRAAWRESQKGQQHSESKAKRLQSNLERTLHELDGVQSDTVRIRSERDSAEAKAKAVQAQYDDLLERMTQNDRLRRTLMVAAQQIKAMQAENAALRGQLGGQELDQAQPRPAEKSAAAVDLDAAEIAADDLGSIKGLSSVYVDRLHQSGIFTLADLAEETPDRVAVFAGLKPWERTDSTGWIEEAKARLAASRRPQA